VRTDRAVAAFAVDSSMSNGLPTLPRFPFVGNPDSRVPSSVPFLPTFFESHLVVQTALFLCRDDHFCSGPLNGAKAVSPTTAKS
jgi:hypothetical protein